MIYRHLFLISILIIPTLISCEEKNELIGTWYYFDVDDAYCELYVNDTLLSYTCDNNSFGDFYYKKKGLKYFFINNEFDIEIVLVENKVDTISALVNSMPVTYHRINKDATFYFNNLSLDINNQNENVNMFRNRRDSILTIWNNIPDE